MEYSSHLHEETMSYCLHKSDCTSVRLLVATECQCKISTQICFSKLLGLMCAFVCLDRIHKHK